MQQQIIIIIIVMLESAAVLVLSHDVQLKIFSEDGSLQANDVYFTIGGSNKKIVLHRQEELMWLIAELSRGYGCRSFTYTSVNHMVTVNHRHNCVQIISATDGVTTKVSLSKPCAAVAAARIRNFLWITREDSPVTEHPCDLFYALRWLKKNDLGTIQPGSSKLLTRAIGLERKIARKEYPCGDWESLVGPVRELMRYLHHDAERIIPPPETSRPVSFLSTIETDWDRFM